MKGLITITLVPLSSYLLTSLVFVVYKTVLIESPCDPKFECLCSFTCMLLPIVICTFILGVGIFIAFMLFGRYSFSYLSRNQLYIFSIAGCILGALVFAYPLATIAIIYSNYLILWFPICLIASIGVIQLAKKI